jgi:CheY-like chemotaxis protein
MTRKILLVEDNLIAQRIASFIIRSIGDEVVVADNGTQAMELAEQQLFDLIIMDIGLPDIDGFTIMETIRSGENWTPMVGLTAHQDLSQNDIFVKPLTREMYQNIIAQSCRVLSSSQWVNA